MNLLDYMYKYHCLYPQCVKLPCCSSVASVVNFLLMYAVSSLRGVLSFFVFSRSPTRALLAAAHAHADAHAQAHARARTHAHARTRTRGAKPHTFPPFHTFHYISLHFM